MDNSIQGIETLDVIIPTEGYVFDVGSLYDEFDQLADARGAQGRRYALAVVLVVLVLAKLAGQHTFVGIAEWARLRAAWLTRVFRLARSSLPSHNTYRRVCQQAVEPQQVQQSVSRVLNQRRTSAPGVLISLDGKTMRGTLSVNHREGLHLLAAYVPGDGVVLMQVAVDHKTNEISAAPLVLECLDLQGQIVMGDALHTQRALSIQIVAQGGDYIWYAKDNQPRLHADIAQTFAPEVCGPGSSPQPTDWVSATQVDKGHGRIEKRTVTTSCLLTGYAAWPHLQQVFKLEREVWDLQKNPLRAEIVYGLTSLSAREAHAARLLELTRSYWGIENGLHYRRDVTLHEDATRMRHMQQAELVAILNNLVLSLLHQHGWHNLASALRYYDAQPAQALRLVLCNPS